MQTAMQPETAQKAFAGFTKSTHVTMKKYREYNENQREQYLANTWVNGPESADKCANIREKLIEMAKLKPGYEEKSEFRKKKRKARKEEMKKDTRKRLIIVPPYASLNLP